jgi:hypothetical protein
LLAAIVAAFMVPVGFALSLESDPSAVSSSLGARSVHARAVSAPTTAVTIPVLMRTATMPYAPVLPAIPEAARLFFVGTALFALAAVMRRAV